MKPNPSTTDLPDWLLQFCADHALPRSYAIDATRYFVPLANSLVKQQKPGQPLLLAINGAQGSGKSTLGDLLVDATRELAGWNAVSVSIDDFYLTRAERLDLAEHVHPLLATRGVPGTHDLGLIGDFLDGVVAGRPVAVPRFDKAQDDRAPQSTWNGLAAPVDLLVLEGWCVAVRPQPEELLQTPANELEATEDADGRWRRYVNASAMQYLPIWERFNGLAMLRVPSFEQVFEWRSRQEQKLVERHGAPTALSDPAAMRRFIQHYERLTRWMLQDLPDRADWLFHLDADQRVTTASEQRP